MARTDILHVRISDEAVAAIDQRAKRENRRRSEVSRRLLAFGLAHMPVEVKKKPPKKAGA